MTAYKVERKVQFNTFPMKKSKWGFHLLSVGDCITADSKHYGRVSSSAFSYSRANGLKIKVRSNGNIVRAWRLK